MKTSMIKNAAFSNAIVNEHLPVIANIRTISKQANKLATKNKKDLNELLTMMTQEQRSYTKLHGTQGLRRGKKTINKLSLKDFVRPLFRGKKKLNITEVVASAESNNIVTVSHSLYGIVSVALTSLVNEGFLVRLSRGIYCKA